MSDKHVKPTKQELAANAQAALDSLEALPADPPVEEPVVAPVVTPDPATPPAEVVPPVEEVVPDPFEKRYRDSSREARKLFEENKEVKEAINSASSVTDPTEEELVKEYPEWEDMTPTEQRLAKKTMVSERRFEALHGATTKLLRTDEWRGKVEAFITDVKTITNNPELDGKEEEFKEFANQAERRNNDFDTLVLAFAGEQAKKVKPQQKGEMFPTGQGGGAAPATKPDDGKISAEEGRILMKTDYKKFKQLLKDKKIKNDE